MPLLKNVKRRASYAIRGPDEEVVSAAEIHPIAPRRLELFGGFRHSANVSAEAEAAIEGD
jgi:hypothetical protein